MTRRGFWARVSHDFRHRGVLAWCLSSVLLGFYLGLYLSHEVKLGLCALGFARPVESLPTHSRILGAETTIAISVHGAGVVIFTAVSTLLVTLVWAWCHRGEPRESLRRAGAFIALKTAVFTLATMTLAGEFANLFEHPVRHGRRLLPVAGEHWPWSVVALVFVLCALGIFYGITEVLRAREDTQRRLRALTLPAVSVSILGLTVLYGTHFLEPTHVLSHDRSLRGLYFLFYSSLDSKWTLYGLLYTVAVSAGGVWSLGRYLHDRYQVVRVTVLVFVQCTLAFSVPFVLELFAYPGVYLSYLWPLKIESFYPDVVFRQPTLLVFWSFIAALIVTPVLGVFFGKRWYCAWVCGCGGLASTAGDPFRHLSQKSKRAWRFERWSSYTVLLFAVGVTLLVGLSSVMSHSARLAGAYWPGHGAAQSWTFTPTESASLAQLASRVRYLYGVVVMSVLSGVLGVGLYPLGGTRTWCRYFCPMAALLGLVQKASRFRVTVQPDLCISCGLCSENCEMGIDVRSYAQANESFTRASCVGCGLCATVCPRGVLRLERHSSEITPTTKLVTLRLHR